MKAKPGKAKPRSGAGAKAPARRTSSPSPAPRVRPIRDRVLVKRLEAEEKAGSILLPDTAKEKPQKAEVVAVGSGRVLTDGKRAPLTVKAGDRVLVGKWAGTEVKIDGTDYLILKEDEILGTLG